MAKQTTPKIETYMIKLAESSPKTHRLVCCYCGGKASRGGLDVDGEYAHKACHAEASK